MRWNQIAEQALLSSTHFAGIKIKAKAVTAILSVTRQLIDEGKRDDIAEQ
jgi:hypothetical protein